ncbi:MAG: 1-acyl-sn-glycerol-3-phosphate acyltransferase [Isosphaeraceae bacterium]
MNRLPLPDQLPYHFHPPRVSPFWVSTSRLFARYLLRRFQWLREFEMSGVEHLRRVVERGDGVLITPNHPDYCDPGVIFELSRRVELPFCYMAAYQIFSGGKGLMKFLLPRIGVFPVDREGADRAAFTAGVDILVKAKNPLVIFPEGEIYYLADRLTPLREGAAALAVSAAKKKADDGKTVWIVPAAIKYRFLDGFDPLPELEGLMTDLEARFTWSNTRARPLLERLYRYAEGLLTLKELEYFDAPRSGDLKERIQGLRSHILDGMEDRRCGKRSEDPVPIRVKNLRSLCLKLLADAQPCPVEKAKIRQDFNDLYLAIQLFSYPGDYVRECPTVERLSEILTKFEQDALGVGAPAPRSPRRALLRLGEPINVGEYLSSGGRSRDLSAAITVKLESRIQGLLDEIGPGRPLPEAMIGALRQGAGVGR